MIFLELAEAKFSERGVQACSSTDRCCRRSDAASSLEALERSRAAVKTAAVHTTFASLRIRSLIELVIPNVKTSTSPTTYGTFLQQCRQLSQRNQNQVPSMARLPLSLAVRVH
ncbi:uncharacterized protein DFL_003127 [Arthrobotrys flagrans]|uniref:Uncharacterized protein n=1 Tax=Arthrobotrys flagrans TaxID=97331 RepID=A0A437ACI7_ARTFL|nr:hypothetical protein DFL_003127 [Arthrobotrys flagrans]